MEYDLLFVALGLGLGAVGTIIGVGGGFILVPVLLLLYPHWRPETITSISLAVIFFNALSGSWAYARMKRIDYKSGLLFAMATIPGAIVGALTTDYIPRRLFDGGFGLLMIAAAAYLFFHRVDESKPPVKKSSRHLTRRVVEANGKAHVFSYDVRVGMGLSTLVGYLSSLLGIGGGIIHVPVLVRLLNFPVHIATATSHFILAIMALTGTIVHISTGSLAKDNIRLTICVVIGVLFGAQGGAALSNHMRGRWIIRALAIALLFVGIRILIQALRS